MKIFARAFFIAGISMAILLHFKPDLLKIVSIPSSDPSRDQLQERQAAEPPAPVPVEIVEMVVNGVTYAFHLASLDVNYVYNEARIFCHTHEFPTLRTAEELERSCTEVLLHNLFAKVNEKRAAAANANAQTAVESTNSVFQVKLPVRGGQVFAVTFDAAQHNPYNVAGFFCRVKHVELGLETEDHLLHGCVPSVGRYMAEQLAAMGYVQSADHIAPPAAEAQTTTTLPGVEIQLHQ